MTIDATFTAVLQWSPSPGGWTYVVWPKPAAYFGTRGVVKVRRTVDGHPAELHKAIGKEAGQRVTVRLRERLA